ncbi:VOC family protein [Devosia sp. A369]
MKVVANIDFDGDCREAFTTYASILGGEVRAMISHRDMPGMAETVPEDHLDRIMHAWIDIGDQGLMGQDMQDFSGRKGCSVTSQPTLSLRPKQRNTPLDGGASAVTEVKSHEGLNPG